MSLFPHHTPPHLKASAAIIVGIASCLMSGTAHAAEPTVEIGAGGLVYAGHQTLSTRREDVVISASRINVTYALLNAAPEPKTALMAFALPELDMMALDGSVIENPAYDPLNPLNFVGFAALIDDQPTETYVEARALALGLVDATTRLRELAVPLYPLLPDLPVRLSALPPNVKAELQAQSLIRQSDGQYEPQWSLRTTLYWQQPFAAGQARRIAISYRPIAGTSVWTEETAASLQQRFCVPPLIAASLHQRAKSPQPVVVRWVTYLATAGAAARGSISTYRIAIETSGAQTAHTCHANLKSRESIQADFIPDEDIHVLFVE